MKKIQLITLPLLLAISSCGLFGGGASLDEMPDTELMAFEMAGYVATGNPAFDNAGGAMAAICTVVKASYLEAVSAVEDSPLVGQFANEVAAAGDDEAAKAKVFATLTPDQKASISRAAQALAGPWNEVFTEMAKTAALSTLLRDGMGSLSGFGMDAKAMEDAKALLQIENVLGDLDTATEMYSRMGEWQDRADAYEREMNRVNY